MGEPDWTVLADSASGLAVLRGVTAGLPKPNGGGTMVYGFRQVDTLVPAVGLYANQADFAPMAKGCDVSGALMHSGNAAIALFAGAQTSVNDAAYMLGLSNASPAHIELRKGALATGLPDEAPNPAGVNKILRQSTNTIAPGTWVHLRLEVVANDNGDAILNCYQNDLSANPVASPVWQAIPGIGRFTDDPLSIATGTPGLVGGRAGFLFAGAAAGSYAAVDRIAIARQL